MIIIDSYDVLIGIGVVVILSVGIAFLRNWLGKPKAPESRCRADIHKLMLDRTCKHGRSGDFRLYYISEEVTPQEFFNYAMKGLHWPEISGVTQKKDFVYAGMKSVNKHGEREDLRMWFFGRENRLDFVKELAVLLHAYEKAGCPTLELEESVESIVARARGETVDFMNKYGFVWEEGL